MGDAASVTWEWVSVPGFVTFWDEKRNKKVTTYALSPFLEAWRSYLWKHRPGHVQLRQPLVPGGRSVLQTVLQQVVQHRDLAKAAWHGLKKLGAVSWGHQGGKLRGLQVWGRWWTQAQPRHYWKTPPGWTLPVEIHVPWPVGDSGWLARDVEGRLVKPKSLWPTDAWLPVPKIPAAMFTRGDRDDPEPQGEDSDTSSACTSDEEPEAEGEETPTTEPVELLEKFDTVAQAEGEPQIPIGMDAEDGDTGVEPTSDSPAAAAGGSGPAEEHVVHVVVDDSDDAGDPINDLEKSATAPAAANDMDVRRKRQRDEDDLPTQPHTLGMWSQRLGAVHSTSCGDLCRCTTLAHMKCLECGDLVTDHWMQASKKVAETIRVKEQTVKDLLRDYMMTTLCRWNEEAGPVSHHLGAVMHELATNVHSAATNMSSGVAYVFQRDGTSAGFSSPLTHKSSTTTPDQRNTCCS